MHLVCISTYVCTTVMTLFILHAAYFNDIVVGGVCCRIETEGDQRRLYIMTLGVLAPYRRLGIGKNTLCDSTVRCETMVHTYMSLY